MKTKAFGYKILLQSLKDQRQTGASCILEKALIAVSGQRNEEEYQNLHNLQIVWESKPQPLGQLFKDQSKNIYNDIIKSPELINQVNELLLNGSSIGPLIKSPPALDPLYIPRTISRRLLVDPKIFKQDCGDIFVMKGGGIFQFSEMSRPYQTCASDSQLHQITCRHIYLLHDDDLDYIIAKATDPVHVIYLDDNNYILIKSKGDTSTLQRFTKRVNNNTDEICALKSQLTSKNNSFSARDCLVANHEQGYVTATIPIDQTYVGENALSAINSYGCLTEESFVKELLDDSSSKGVCVCDNAGMGKTWFLHKSSDMLKFYNCVSIFLNLLTFGVYLAENTIDDSSLSQVIGLLKHICPTDLAGVILGHFLTSRNTKVVLICDGYDEIRSEHIPEVRNFLNRLVKSKTGIKICVSSRTHFRKELEGIFMVHSYDLLPFSKTDQANALVDRWTQMYPKNNVQKLQQFAEKCVETIGKMLNSDILGIPLMCFMISKIHAHQAGIISNNKGRSNGFPDIDKYSVVDIFQKYIQLGQDRLRQLYTEEHEYDDAYNRIICYHEWKALELVHPQLAVTYYVARLNNLSQDEAPVLGVLIPAESNSASSELTFIHKLFAEYFVANMLVEFLTESTLRNVDHPISHQFYVECFNQTVLSICKEDRVRLNCFTKDWDTQTSMITFKFLHHNVVWILNSCLESQPVISRCPGIEITSTKLDLYKLLQCCVRYDFSFLLNVISITTVSFTNDNNDTLPEEGLSFLLYLVAIHSSSKTAEILMNVSEKVLGTNLLHFCNSYPSEYIEPIIAAIERNSLDLVLFYSDKLPLDATIIFPTCLKFYNSSKNDRKARKEICSLLFNKNSKIFLPTKFDDDFGIGYYDTDIMNHIASMHDFRWTQLPIWSKLTILFNVLCIGGLRDFTDMLRALLANGFEDTNSQHIFRSICPNTRTGIFMVIFVILCFPWWLTNMVQITISRGKLSGCATSVISVLVLFLFAFYVAGHLTPKSTWPGYVEISLFVALCFVIFLGILVGSREREYSYRNNRRHRWRINQFYYL